MTQYKKVKKWVSPHMRTINGKRVKVKGHYTTVEVSISPRPKAKSTFYEVFNATDGIPASPRPFKTIQAAKKFIADFPKRYARQGHYFTNRQIRIKPEAVELVIYNDKREEVYNNQYGN